MKNVVINSALFIVRLNPPFLHSFTVLVEECQCVLKNAQEEVNVAGAIRSQEGPE